MASRVDIAGRGQGRAAPAVHEQHADPMWTLSRVGVALSGSVLPFALVFYLALKGGGFDTIVYSEVGIAVWWILVLGTLAGVVPVARITRAGWVFVGVLGAFAVWTALGIGWSESSERSVAELGRVGVYLGVFALALSLQGRDGIRRTVNAVAAAIALVGVLALLSRLHPSWFPTDDASRLLHETSSRLKYPLNYWNGVAALMAMGIPLLVLVAVSSRHLLSQALGAAAIPAIALTTFFTFSRGGALEVAVALIALLALYPRRLAILPTLLTTGAGSAILIAGAAQRNALQDGLLNSTARAQGDEMLAMVLVVCAGIGLIQVAIALAARHGLGPRPKLHGPAVGVSLAGVAVAAVAIALAAGLPSELGDRWDEFKQPGGPSGGVERFQSSSGNGRYQYWQSSVDANRTDAATGIGPGTFEYWWAREGTLSGFVRDAHSLYFQTLGEAGILGLVLIVGLILGAVALGAARALLRGPPERRALIAAATAACAAFAVAAAVDWAWQLTVLPVTFLLLTAAVLGPSAERGQDDDPRPNGDGRALRWPARIAVAIGAIAFLGVIAIPMAATGAVRKSDQDVQAGRLGAALDEIHTARDVQPYAATPDLEQALVLELRGDLGGAATAAHAATRAEPTNWRTWFVRSRIEAERGRAAEAVSAYRTARSLNPRSVLFAQ